MQLQLGIREIIYSDCKHVFTFDWLLTWLFLTPYSIPRYFPLPLSHFHCLSSFVIFPLIPPSLLICFSIFSLSPFLVPSIPSVLSLYLSLEIQPVLAFLKTSVLSSPAQIPLSQNHPSFLRNSFRILFVIPLETQRTPEGGKPKYFSKPSSGVVLWECELDSLTTEKIVWNHTLPGALHAHICSLCIFLFLC